MNTTNSVQAIIEIECTPEREFGFDRTAMRIARYPEVLDISVVFGRPDLLVIIEAENMAEISRFVTEVLASMENVHSTSTQFFLKNFKRSGVIMREEPKTSRIPVSL